MRQGLHTCLYCCYDSYCKGTYFFSIMYRLSTVFRLASVHSPHRVCRVRQRVTIYISQFTIAKWYSFCHVQNKKTYPERAVLTGSGVSMLLQRNDFYLSCARVWEEKLCRAREKSINLFNCFSEPQPILCKIDDLTGVFNSC